MVAPSAIFMLSDFDDTKDVNLRPYLGGGINYAKASIAVDSTPEERDRASGAGGQAFGGLELTFKEAPNVSLDFQVIHRWQPSGATGGLDGTRVNGAVYFYF